MGKIISSFYREKKRNDYNLSVMILNFVWVISEIDFIIENDVKNYNADEYKILKDLFDKSIGKKLNSHSFMNS